MNYLFISLQLCDDGIVKNKQIVTLLVLLEGETSLILNALTTRTMFKIFLPTRSIKKKWD